MWDLNKYYCDESSGLLGKLTLTDDEKSALKILRKTVRVRTRDVFHEAKGVARFIKKGRESSETIENRLRQTKLKYLSDYEIAVVADLIGDMDDEARSDFLSLEPRFATQGSFQYDTLNRPLKAPQEMDIDDGTYMPMTIFEGGPRLGHNLLFLLVDCSLKSLAAENEGWKFESKRTCARIKISARNTHIDVPVYAIPKEQFLKKALAMESASSSAGIVLDSLQRSDKDLSYETLDPKFVNLALREGPSKWCNSDPKIVEDWFEISSKRIGDHLKPVCRFMKAWRDAQWDVGGPSSICLMAAIVNVLDRTPHDGSNMTDTMKVLAKELPQVFRQGVESPDETDEKLLFPALEDHKSREQDIVERLDQLLSLLSDVESASSKGEALSKLGLIFGNRVQDALLIEEDLKSEVLNSPAEKTNKPQRISVTMASA